jgi:hypothetical protein
MLKQEQSLLLEVVVVQVLWVVSVVLEQVQHFMG